MGSCVHGRLQSLPTAPLSHVEDQLGFQVVLLGEARRIIGLIWVLRGFLTAAGRQRGGGGGRLWLVIGGLLDQGFSSRLVVLAEDIHPTSSALLCRGLYIKQLDP